VKGPLAFYFNFGAPGQVDILYIKAEENPPAEHRAKIALPQGHETYWQGAWLENHQGQRANAVKKQPKIGYWQALRKTGRRLERSLCPYRSHRP
jgi:hypothetical protein